MGVEGMGIMNVNVRGKVNGYIPEASEYFLVIIRRAPVIDAANRLPANHAEGRR